jgi:hypothetical protein
MFRWQFSSVSHRIWCLFLSLFFYQTWSREVKRNPVLNETDSVCITFEARSRNHCCRGKSISIAYSECVFVAVVIQHAKRMFRIILSLAFLAVPYFFTLSNKRHDGKGEKLLKIKRVYYCSLHLLAQTCLDLWILSYTHLARPVNYPAILVRFYLNMNSMDRISERTVMSNFIKIYPFGAQCIHADA